MVETPSKPRIWLALLPAMILPFAASLFYFVFFSRYTFARVLFGATKVFTVVWPVVAVWFVLRGGLPRVAFRSAHHWKAIPPGLLTGAAIALLMWIAMQTSLGHVVGSSADAIRAKASELGIMEYFWPLVLFLSFVNSLVEEYYWRWFLFGHLRQVLPVFLAHMLAGVAFAAHHVVITTQFFPMSWGLLIGAFVGVAGVIWSVMYARQQTIMGVWVSHIIADLGIMFIGYNLLFGK